NIDDDTPRLVYADWLEDRGQEDRACFIRLQCRAARLDKADPARMDLIDQVHALLNAHEDEWLAPLRAAFDTPSSKRLRQAIFQRGFVERLDLTLEKADRLARAGEVLRQIPLRVLSLETGSAKRLTALVGELAKRPELSCLEQLDLDAGSGSARADL